MSNLLQDQQFSRLVSTTDNGGGQLRPQRLTGEEMDEISPGWTENALKRAQRSDGGNG